MRTVVILDDDVAQAVARIAQDEGVSPEKVINTALREFVGQRRPDRARSVYTTSTVDLGACLIDSLDDVQEALCPAEADGAR